MTARLRDENTPDDETQKLIKAKSLKIAETNAVGSWRERFLLHQLLSDYEWIKHIPCHEVVPDLVQAWMFSDGTDTDGIKSTTTLSLT